MDANNLSLEERLAAALAEADRQRKRADEEAAKNNDTVYFEYLHNIQTYVSTMFRVETNRSQMAAGNVANVGGKMYPRILRRWVDFPEQHRRQFDDLATLFGDSHLFPSLNDSKSVARNLSPGLRRDEQDVRGFVRACLETPSMNIVNAFLRRQTTDPRHGDIAFKFANNALGTARQRSVFDGNSSASNAPSRYGRRRSAPTRKTNSSSSLMVPDRWGLCFRVDESGNDVTVFPIEYKAAHKLKAGSLRNILGNNDALPAESLIGNCARRSSNDSRVDDIIPRHPVVTGGSDGALSEHRRDEMTVAQVLTQIYHYMISSGLMYGYLTSGEGTVLLLVEHDSADTLLYHYVDHEAVPSPITQPENDLMFVPASQLATLIMKSLVAVPRSAAITTDLHSTLPRWPKGSDEDPDLSSPDREGDDSDGSANTGGGGPGYDSGMPPPPRPSSTGRGNRLIKKSGPSRPFDRFEPPRSEYCTQACLWGLAYGGPLDPACPNTPEHASGERQITGEDGRPYHPISAVELCDMMLDQLTRSLSAGVECLMKYRMFGTIGTLYKVTLCAYGYTFVAKGSQDAHWEYLMGEAELYANPATRDLQGVMMPVYLGGIELREWPYILPSGAHIWHMMFLSWAGVSLATRVPECISSVDDVIDSIYSELRHHGICHNDVRDVNLAWNEELGRVMALDFDRAYLLTDKANKDGDGSSLPVSAAATTGAGESLEKTEANNGAVTKSTAVEPVIGKRKREDDGNGVEKRARTAGVK